MVFVFINVISIIKFGNNDTDGYQETIEINPRTILQKRA